MKIAINGEILEVSGLPEGAVPVKPLTKAEYDALTDEERQADVVYAITDDGGSGSGGDSSEEIYSTEEVRIGTWIDGKPLYRKVITGTVESSANDITPTISFGNEDLELCKTDVEVFGKDGITFSGSYYQSPTNWLGIFTVPIYKGAHNRGVYIQYGSVVDSKIPARIHCIIEYTKTTDEATS